MNITVKIRAAVDGDLTKILYEPLAQASGRARAKTRADTMSARDESLAVLRDRLARERALAAANTQHELALKRDAIRQEARERVRAAQETKREEHRILAQSQRDDREKAKILATAERMAARARAREQQQSEQTVRTFASSASGTVGGLVKRGVGFASDMARGAGVSFDLSTGVRKRVELESKATQLANSGYIEGEKGSAGIRQDPRAIMADVQRTGEKYGISQDDIAQGLDKFVGKTGELQTGRDMLESFAKVSKATGANLEDVAAAAGAISNKLGDVPDKANAINKVMLAIAGQGKVGAVEIKDLATKMEKLTSMASKFQSNKGLMDLVGTHKGANIAMLGVLSQAARKTEKGSAAQATQSAMAFVRDLTGHTAIERIGAGTIFTDKTRQQVRDPQEIVKDIIARTKGDQSKLTHLMANQNSRAVVNAFMDPYMKAYNATKGTDKDKDKAGRQAVDEEFAKLKRATLSDKTQQDAINESMKTTATKVEQFQQKLDRVVGDMADQVIPAMLKLAPAALNAAGTMSKLAQWTVDNPGKALGGVVGLSIVKAGAEAGGKALLDKGVGALGGSPKMAGALIGTLVIASVGSLMIEKVANDKTEANKARVGDEANTVNTVTGLRAAMRKAEQEQATSGQVSPETQQMVDRAKAAAQKEQESLQARIAKAEKIKQGEGTGFFASTLNSLASTMLLESRVGGGDTMQQRARGEQDAEHLQTMIGDLKALQEVMGGTLKVEVVNLSQSMPALPGNVTGPATN